MHTHHISKNAKVLSRSGDLWGSADPAPWTVEDKNNLMKIMQDKKKFGTFFGNKYMVLFRNSANTNLYLKVKI